MDNFKLVSKYKPAGDQPEAIDKIVENLNDGIKNQVLLGVTGSGKTFTMASVIEKINRPTLVIAHNKTLAAQLCSELKQFFPNNRVEFFVSYYDYYQPEAYIFSTDTYIEKDMSINDEIDKLRHSATSSLLERNDVIVVASVSCIYGLGAPEEYLNLHLSLRKGDNKKLKDIIKRLIEIRYERNDLEFSRGKFRSRGDTLDIFPASSSKTAIRIEFFGDEIENIFEIDALTNKKLSTLSHVAIYPASHYATSNEKLKSALSQIEKDKNEQVNNFENNGKLIEAQRINERVNYDMEFISEMGYCNGIENYSRYFDGRQPGEPPFTLLDYFKNGFVTFIDESHMTLPQIRAMYNGDKARKTSLVEYGFRLPSAFDNRPLTFNEFNERIGQTIYISATPGDYELELAQGNVAEQIIRPTGLVDPVIEVKSIENQVEDVYAQILLETERKGKVLITTLTKKMAENLTEFLAKRGIKVRYMHSDIDTLERIEIIKSLRKGEFDVLVGINLLREGLDLPEVTLVAILDADKEGFLRSDHALIQTVGRAARNKDGHVIMYANVITGSMQRAIDETNRRRDKQINYNKLHNITPQSIVKDVYDTFEISKKITDVKVKLKGKELLEEIDRLTELMKISTDNLDFERAIEIRDYIKTLRGKK